MRLRENIPLIDLGAQYESIRDEIAIAVNRALQSPGLHRRSGGRSL